ncbi:MAG: hypothetical protein F9K29_20340 [Hyphomicrobiaceae bacterium]|nr:MAG: hypothetical protein F9K29_20340 [Hyphomicrobiaceae bacterium]
MRLASTRFTSIDGTAVAVTVTSAEEAKAALKELRHKKRELKFLRSALVRRQKTLRAKQGKGRRANSLFWKLIAGVGSVFSWVIDLLTLSRAERRARNPSEIDKELRRTDEILHNIEGCILQIEGKLLAQG